MGPAGGRTWSMMKVPFRKMPTWQKMHALRSTMQPCSSSSKSQSCNAICVIVLHEYRAMPRLSSPDALCIPAPSQGQHCLFYQGFPDESSCRLPSDCLTRCTDISQDTVFMCCACLVM